jgi:large subunit ribosomal protein L25
VDKIGVLLQPLAEVEVEALPTDLPEKIEIDVSKLSQIDEALFVKNLQIDVEKVNILNSPDEIVVKIGPLITKEMEEQLAAEKAAAEAAAAEAAAPAPAEGTETPVAPEEKVTRVETKPEGAKTEPESTKSSGTPPTQSNPK